MEREKEIGKMIIKRIIVGPIEANCYLVGDEATKETIIIDPGDEAGKILRIIKENDLKPKFILLTHNHPDHTGAVEKLRTDLDINIKVGPWEEDGNELEFGNFKIEVLATPGHSEESICYVIENNPPRLDVSASRGGAGIFSGDTLFKGGIGRTDLEGGDFNQIQKSLKRLMQFPDNFKVFPGHGPETTIGEERKNNPFLL